MKGKRRKTGGNKRKGTREKEREKSNERKGMRDK
jgi:hypothetical protein